MSPAWDSTKAKLYNMLGAEPAAHTLPLADGFTDGESEYHGIQTEEQEQVAAQKKRRKMLMGAGVLVLALATVSLTYSLSGAPALTFLHDDDDDDDDKLPKPDTPPPPMPFPPKPSPPPPPSPKPPKPGKMYKTSFVNFNVNEDTADGAEEGEDAGAIDLKKMAPPSPTPPAQSNP